MVYICINLRPKYPLLALILLCIETLKGEELILKKIVVENEN